MAQPATSYIPQTDASAATRKVRTVQRTDGGDTVEEWLQADSEPFLASYRLASATAAAISTANSHILQIMAGASLRVGIRRVQVYQVAAANAAASIILAVYRLTTAGTGGTSITPAPLDPADSASGAAGMILPSSKGTESTLLDYRQAQISATASTVGLQPIATFDFIEIARTKGPWIAAGTSNGIAVKCVSSDSAATLRTVSTIVEASWT